MVAHRSRSLPKLSLKNLRTVAADSDESWSAAALEALRRNADLYATVTSDDVWFLLGEVSPSEPRMMGAVFERARALNYIISTNDFVKSDRRSCHGRRVRVWRSLIVSPQKA